MIGVENFLVGGVQSSRRRARDSLQGASRYSRTRTHRMKRWVRWVARLCAELMKLVFGSDLAW